MLFKICAVDRQQRKFAKAENIRELLEKAITLLQFDCAVDDLCLVTEKDGYDVEDDEILTEIKSEPLMVLRKKQRWISPLQEQTATSVDKPENVTNPAAATPIIDQNLNDALAAPRPVTSEPGPSKYNADGPSQTEHVPRSQTTCSFATCVQQNGLPSITKKFSVPLPLFSTFVTENLENGRVLNCFNNLISECAHFYMNRYNITTSGQYQEIGEQLYIKYPCIKFPKGAEPWTLFCEKLSQKIRNLRFQQKRKSLEGNPTSNAAKRPNFQSSKSPSACEISSGDYENHVKELSVEMEKSNPNKQHIALLLKETHVNRRKWLSTLPGGSWAPLMQSFPCFNDIEHIINEYCILRNQKNIEGEMKNLENLFKMVLRHAKTVVQGTNTEKEIAMVMYAEKVTAFDKGKGKKTESVISVKKEVAEAEIESCCASKETSPPRLLCFTENNKLQEAVVIGDGQKIFCRTDSVLEALLYLVLVYYVTDLDYPRQYSQILGLVQRCVLKQPYDGGVSGKYVKFCHYMDAELGKSSE